jgi:hypothetical protein
VSPSKNVPGLVPKMLDHWHFTDLYKHSKGVCKYSPDSNYIAIAVENQLVIRSHSDLVILNVYPQKWPVDLVCWSPDSEKILMASLKESIYYAYHMDNADWQIHLKDTVRPLAYVRFSADSNSIMNTQQFQASISRITLRKINCCLS